MDYVLLCDLARWYCTVAAILIVFLIVRLVLNRLRREGSLSLWGSPSPLTSLGTALLMVGLILRRLDDLGERGDKFLWIATTAVTLMGAGLLMSTRITPPWRRGRDTSPPKGVN